MPLADVNDDVAEHVDGVGDDAERVDDDFRLRRCPNDEVILSCDGPGDTKSFRTASSVTAFVWKKQKLLSIENFY